MTKELNTLKAKLETEIRHTIELDEQLVKANKEKAKAEVDKSQVEKELLAERQRRHDLEERASKAEESLSKLSDNSTGVTFVVVVVVLLLSSLADTFPLV